MGGGRYKNNDPPPRYAPLSGPIVSATEDSRFQTFSTKLLFDEGPSDGWGDPL